MLDRVKGVRVGQVVTCLVCGQETQVAAIPLHEIKEASTIVIKYFYPTYQICSGERAGCAAAVRAAGLGRGRGGGAGVPAAVRQAPGAALHRAVQHADIHLESHVDDCGQQEDQEVYHLVFRNRIDNIYLHF